MADQLHDLIGAYAVDSLDPRERAAFEQHLATCDECQNELIGLTDALAELASDYEVEPPAALRGAVLSAVAKLAPSTTPATDADGEGTVAGDDSGTAAPGDGATPEPTQRRHPGTDEPDDDPADPDPIATVTPLRRAGSGSGRSRWQVLVAAAVAVIAVIGIAVWQPWAPRAVTAADVLAAPDAVRATQPAQGGGSVTLVRSNQLGKAVLVTDDLAPAPAGKAHQAWLLQPGGAMESAGMMPDSPDVTMLLEGDARDAVGAGISVEPPAGSPQPTGTIVAQVEL